MMKVLAWNALRECEYLTVKCDCKDLHHLGLSQLHWPHLMARFKTLYHKHFELEIPLDHFSTIGEFAARHLSRLD